MQTEIRLKQIFPEITDGEARWEIEKIVDDYQGSDSVSFLVKWLGDPVQQWVPVHCMDRCAQLLEQYYEEKGKDMPEMVKAVMENAAPLEERNSDNYITQIGTTTPLSGESSDSDWTP